MLCIVNTNEGLNHIQACALLDSVLQMIQKEARCTVLSGHVLHLPFSDGFSDAIQAAVLNTGVHMTTDERCKFAMAAHLEQTGAAFVCGWWIYICRVREGLRLQPSSEPPP